MCSTHAPLFPHFISPPSQKFYSYLYELSNPYDYLSYGNSALLHEIGPFKFTQEIIRPNASFDDSLNTFSFVQYTTYEFDSDTSCSDCRSTEKEFVVFNSAYNALLQQVKHEAALLLSLTCSRAQIAAIMSPNPISFCTAAQQGSAANCKCCFTGSNPGGGAVSCSSLLQPTSKPGGLISWLAKYDGGFLLSGTLNPNGFPLASGVYSPLVRNISAPELFFGSASPLLGYIQYRSGSFDARQAIANTTKDLRDVCYELFCPSVEELVDQIQHVGSTQGYQFLSGISCAGRVPSKADLMRLHGFTEDRANSLRYLEGVNCRVLTPSVVAAALVRNSTLTYSCHNSGEALPCCLSNIASSGAIRGPGYGCVRFVDGIATKRRVFSLEEASLIGSGPNQFYTYCASKSERFIQTLDRGASLIKRWFTPRTYSYPRMSWADPSVSSAGILIDTKSAYELNYSNTSILELGHDSHFLTLNDPVPLKSSLFYTKSLSSRNTPLESNQIRQAYVANFFDVLSLQFEKSVLYGGTQVFKYNFLMNISTDPAIIEHRQRRGQVPYQNLFNLLYATSGRPVITSLPNFYGVEEGIWNQTDNRNRQGLPGNGVELYRLFDTYGEGAKRLPQPIVNDVASVSEFSDIFLPYIKFSQMTGAALETSSSNMISSFTLNCNPSLDSTCGLITSPVGVNPLMCYPAVSSGVNVHRPCSAANIFTPRVHGEKVIPIGWFRVHAPIPKRIFNDFVVIIGLLFGVSVGIIVVAVLTFFSLIAASAFVYYYGGEGVSKAAA
jgi:hypothetical protein